MTLLDFIELHARTNIFVRWSRSLIGLHSLISHLSDDARFMFQSGSLRSPVCDNNNWPEENPLTVMWQSQTHMRSSTSAA